MGRMAPNRAEAVLPVASLTPGMYFARVRLADGRRTVRSFVKE